MLVFGPPGVGKTHVAIALGRAAIEAGYSVLTSATALLGAPEGRDGQLTDRLAFYRKPKLLIVDELGYLRFEKRSAHLFFQLVARRHEKGSMFITTNQLVTQWGTGFGDEVLAAAILDRLLHHSFTLMVRAAEAHEASSVVAQDLGWHTSSGQPRRGNALSAAPGPLPPPPRRYCRTVFRVKASSRAMRFASPSPRALASPGPPPPRPSVPHRRRCHSRLRRPSLPPR